MTQPSYFANYAPTENASGVPEKWAIQGHGVRKAYIQNSANVTSGDVALSTYLVAKDVPASAILSKIEVETDALTSLTQCKVGIYDSDSGVAIVDNVYAASNLDLHTASAKNAPLDGMPSLTHESTLQEVYKLAGHTLNQARGKYDIVLTLTQTAGATGVATFRTEILPAG